MMERTRLALFATIAVLHESGRLTAFLSTSPNRCKPKPGAEISWILRDLGPLPR